jgi:hypothetical protein
MKIRSARFLITTAVLTAALCLLFTSSCAKIAEPQPPEVFIPKAATDLAAIQIADSVSLSVSLPDLNADRSKAANLSTVEVFRIIDTAKGMPAPLTEKEFLARATNILSIPASRFSSYLHNQTLIIKDASPLPNGANPASSLLRYAAIFINKKSQAAGLSNQVSIQLISIPPAPEGIFVEASKNALTLKWQAPSANTDGSIPVRIAGYNVYRSEQPDSVPSLPLNPAPLQLTEFQDRNFDFDKTYFYSVSTIGNIRDPFAESLPSKTVEVKTRDVFPPAPPGDFNAIYENHKVLLLWTPSAASDVAGYRIYRKETDASSFQLLQDTLVTGFSFQDRKIELNKTYEYSIQAVDAHGNESAAVRMEVITQ